MIHTIENFWGLYKIYIDYYVVRNEELKKVMFHSLVGTILTHKGYRYTETADKLCTTRCHVFAIQDSGTGKSLIMNINNDLLTYIGIKTDKTVTFNEAAMVGSVYEYQGTIKKQKGKLGKLLALFVDEGSELFNENSYTKGLRAQFQNLMDEPGIISKDMKLGTIKYPSKCTLITGSYIFDEFNVAMVNTGFLQRMIVTYKDYTSDEKEAMWTKVELLKLKHNSKRLVKAREAIRTFVDSIPPYEVVDPETNPLLLHDKSVKRSEIYLKSKIFFSRKYVYTSIECKKEMNKQFIRNQFTGTKQKIFSTYFNRAHLITDKIAVQRAILNGEKDFREKIVVKKEDLEYALEITKYHLKSIQGLFDIFENSKKFKVNNTSEIVKVVAKNPGIIQNKLLDKLMDSSSSGKWSAGKNKTMKILADMVAEGNEIVVKTGDKNAKKYYLKEIK